MYILIFISLIITSLFILKKYLFCTIFVIIFTILFRKKRLNKKILLLIITTNLILIILFLIKTKLSLNFKYFLILERKENYIIIFNGFNKYYLNIKYLNIPCDQFDIIFLDNYSLNEFGFIKLESGFDFASYLNSKGVLKEIKGNFEIIFDFPINYYSIKNNILNSISDEKVKIFLNTMLFNQKNNELNELSGIRNLNLINLFSLSGFYINFTYYFILNILNYAFNNKISKILVFLILIPYLMLNIQSFFIIKFILSFILNFIEEFKTDKIKYSEKQSIVGIIILLINMHLILSDSFILSFSISFMNYYVNNIIKTKNKILKKLLYGFYLMIFLLPFSIKYNYSINILSFIFSFLILPINKILFLFGLFLLLFQHNFLIELLFKMYIELMNFIPNSFSLINVPEFNNSLILIYYFCYFTFIYFKEVNLKQIYKKIVYFKILILCIHCLPIQNYLFLKISFINVGQGDSTLITLNNKNYLIDTGGLTYNDIACNNLIPFFKKNRIYKIDEVFITHYDYDHYGSLENLKANFSINKIYDYNTFINKENPFILKNLNIYKDLYEEENNKSLVLYFSYKNITFLFMGDASKEIEYLILNDNNDIHADYIKIGHHGSKTSTSDEFLNEVKPKEAIISCGENNKYNHPHEETIKILNNHNINIRRTDIEGTINYYFFKF